MSKARTLANFISDNNEFADGTISVSEVSGAAPLASPTFTGTINSNGNTIINERLDVNKQGEAFRLRTGDASTQNYISIGRTGEDARITMSGGANNAIQTSAAGDLVIGANNNLLMGRIGSPYINLNSTGVVINELGGSDKDFRVESDSNANMLFVDAGASTATFGSNTAYGVLGIQQGASAGIPATTLGLNHIHANNKYIDFKWYDGSLMNIAQEGGSNIGINWSNTLAFNSSESGSSDFRIASDTISHLFAIDASENRVSIGGTNFGEGSGYIFNVRGGTSRFANPAADATVRIEGGSYTDPHRARLTLTGGYGDTGRTRFWHIDGQAHGGGGNVYNDLRFGYEVSNSATLYEVMRFNNEGHVIVNENGASNVDFRVETDSINDAFVIDADQDVIKFKTNVWQHAPLTGNFAGGWVTVTNLDTLSNLVSNSAAKIRVYANENGRTNVSYSEHIAVRTNGTWVLQQLGEVTAGNSHGNANLQMSGTNLQIQNAANSSIGAWKVSLELFR